MKRAVTLRQVIVMVLAFAMICVPIDLIRPQVYAEEETNPTGEAKVAVPEKSGDYVIMSSEMPDGDSEKIVETEDTSLYVSDSEESEGEDAVVEENMIFEASEEGNSEEGIWITSDDAEEIMEKHNTDWNVDMINADAEQTKEDATENKESVKIAVLDSGADFAACDANITKAVNLVEDEQDYENMLNDMSGHGSAVASIISSIDPNAEIYSVRVLDKDNRGTLSRIVSGIYWCIDNDVDIINMSFGSDNDSEILEKAIEDAKEHGILMVSAAGNDPEKGVQYPARLNDVISVGSVDSNGEMSEENADGDMDVTAPGEDIFTQSALGLYTVVSGTSMAAPHVAAAASLLWKEDRDKPADFIAGLISGSENKTNNDSGDDAGIVDVDYAREVYDEYENDVEKIPQNDSEVVTFADGEVNASWGSEGGGHTTLANYGLDHTKSGKSLDNDEKEALKKGAVYPDDVGNLTHKYAHGSRKTNYIASYIFLTALAQKYRLNSEKLVKPIAKDVFGRGGFSDLAALIKDDFYYSTIYRHKTTDAHIKTEDEWQKWNKAREPVYWTDNKTLGDCHYNNKTKPQQAKLKSLFVYGIALHDLTDTFAHSSYGYKNDDIAKPVYPIVHSDTYKNHKSNSINGADNPGVASKRWEDSQYMSKKVINKAVANALGKVSDFYPEDTSKSMKYFIHNINNKAADVDGKSSHSELKYINVVVSGKLFDGTIKYLNKTQNI